MERLDVLDVLDTSSHSLYIHEKLNEDMCLTCLTCLIAILRLNNPIFGVSPQEMEVLK